MLIEPHYFPVSAYFSLLLKDKILVVDDVSLFQKQSYRNRAYISGANSVLKLIVPLKAGKNNLPMREVRIDNGINWARSHWQSICSAYNKSPWFEFYAENYYGLLHKPNNFLIDLDLSLIQQLLTDLKINTELKFLSDGDGMSINDFRDYLHPKERRQKPVEGYFEKEYTQVFSERFGFIKGLSVIDLLFNTGPEAKYFLTEAIRK